MLISRLCSWCDSMNVVGGPRQCPTCGHDALLPRLGCTCFRCLRARHRAASADTPVSLADAIAGAIAAIGPRGGQDETPADGPATTEGEATMSKKNKNTPEPAPVTREVVRTTVSPKLAEIVRAMDDALLDEFGPYAAFAYVLMGGDGLIAASDSVHGFVPPVVSTRTGIKPDGDNDIGGRKEARDAE